MWMRAAYYTWTQRPSLLALRVEGHHTLSPHSSNKPGELYNGYGHHDSTINIDSGIVAVVVVVIIIITSHNRA